MVSKHRISFYLAVFPLVACLMIGCSKKTGDEKTNTTNSSKKTQDDDSKSDESNTSDKSSDGDAMKDTGPLEPIAAEQFPKPANAEKPMYTSDTSTVMFHQEGTVDAQVTFYTDELEKLGWAKKDSSEVVDGVAFMDFEKGSLGITITINPLREGMITTIAQGNGLSVPASLEQDEDEFEDDEVNEDNPVDGG